MIRTPQWMAMPFLKPVPYIVPLYRQLYVVALVQYLETVGRDQIYRRCIALAIAAKERQT